MWLHLITFIFSNLYLYICISVSIVFNVCVYAFSIFGKQITQFCNKLRMWNNNNFLFIHRNVYEYKGLSKTKRNPKKNYFIWTYITGNFILDKKTCMCSNTMREKHKEKQNYNAKHPITSRNTSPCLLEEPLILLLLEWISSLPWKK